MKLIIISGLSGSGKSIALNTLEDENYYCVDNLPPGLLLNFVDEINNKNVTHYSHAAVGIDARANMEDLKKIPDHLNTLKNNGIDVEVIFLHATDVVLVKRFNETRRKHPLSQNGEPLLEAIQQERKLLSPIQENADLVIDTTRKNIYELRDLVIDRLRTPGAQNNISILFQSFGFKHGVPGDTDFVFDVRCLPNPHWVAELRSYTGKDQPVIDFLSKQTIAKEMQSSIMQFIETWLPRYIADNRRYLTISIGCTGGQHRSVFICEELAEIFSKKMDNVSVRHRELS